MKKLTTLSSHFRNQQRYQSPIPSPSRPLSPFRTSPFSRPTPLSPLRSRCTPTRTILTPTKYRTANNRKILTADFASSPRNVMEASEMQKTIKSGVGLFQQQLAQCKQGSERKQNRFSTYQTKPFDFSEQRSETRNQNYPKNSFAALISGVKEIQSFQSSKAMPYELSNVVKYGPSLIKEQNQNPSIFKQIPSIKSNINFQTIVQSREEINNRSKKVMREQKNYNTISALESFGSCLPSNGPQKQEEEPQQSVIHNNSFGKEEKEEKEEEQQKKSKQLQIVENKQSYSDILFLLKRGSQKQKDESVNNTDENVRVSLQLNELNESSMNMNPLI